MLKGPEEVLTVLIVLEHCFLFVAARGHMINSTGVFYAKGTSHELTIASEKCNVNSKDLTLRGAKKCRRRVYVNEKSKVNRRDKFNTLDYRDGLGAGNIDLFDY
jgi:hypothetical protein